MKYKERLTRRIIRNGKECFVADFRDDKGGVYENGQAFGLAINRLAEYEDTLKSPAKIMELQTEFDRQHELLDQYELGCTDMVVVEKNKAIEALKAENLNLSVRDEALKADNDNLLRTLEEGNEEVETLRAEADELLNNKNPAIMTSPIGDLPINSDGMRKAVDEIARLTKESISKEDAYNKAYGDYKYWKQQYLDLKAENLRLTEQLKNSVVLPCKVGDTVWVVYTKEQFEPIDIKVANIIYQNIEGKGQFQIQFKIEDDMNFGGIISDELTTIFLTKSEAEQRLAELNGGKE